MILLLGMRKHQDPFLQVVSNIEANYLIPLSIEVAAQLQHFQKKVQNQV